MDSISDLYSIGKDIAKAVASAEDKMRIMELAGKAADLEEENRALRKRVEELSAELARKKKLETERGSSYILEDDGTRTGPICKACYDQRDLVIILESSARGGAWCPNCRTRYPGAARPNAAPDRGSPEKGPGRGLSYTGQYLAKRAKPGSVNIVRTDNLRISERAKDSVTARHY